MKPKSFFVPVVALALTALSGLVRGLPLNFLEPILTIQMVGAPAPLFPFGILFVPLLVDLAIWFLISLGVWWLFKCWSKVVLIPVIVLVVVFGIFVFWQYNLYQNLSQTDMACGGDWAYMVKCPFGSYCRSLGQGPLVGGICSSWLSPVLGFLRSPKEQEEPPSPVGERSPTVPTPTIPTIKTENWQTFSNGNFLYSVKYPNDWPTVASIEVGEKTSSIGRLEPELKGRAVNLSKHLPEVRPPYLQIESFLDVTPTDFENIKARSCSASAFDVTETTIDGAPAVVGHCVAPNIPGRPDTTEYQYCAVIYKDTIIYDLTWHEGSFEDSGLFNGIISTFKFLD